MKISLRAGNVAGELEGVRFGSSWDIKDTGLQGGEAAGSGKLLQNRIPGGDSNVFKDASLLAVLSGGQDFHAAANAVQQEAGRPE